MTNSYCGKNCEECTHRDLLECPGCKEGPGGTRPCQCELARCCRDKGLPHCGECTLYSACGKLPARNAIPVERLKAQEAEKEERAKLVQKSKILGPWLWALFLLVFPLLLPASSPTIPLCNGCHPCTYPAKSSTSSAPSYIVVSFSGSPQKAAAIGFPEFAA